MFKKEIVIDGKDHLVGRLASYVSKQLLNGAKVIVVRSEKLVMAGSTQRHKLMFGEYLEKAILTNPTHSHHHCRSPSRMFFKAVTGMIGRKKARGEHALGRLKVFEGVPHPYDMKKRMIVTDALRQTRLKPYRSFCILGELAKRVGWRHELVVKRLEEKRVDRAKRYYEEKKKRALLKAKKEKAEASESIKKINGLLANFGY